MSLNTVKEHLKKYNKENDIIILEESSRTVDEAALALNTDPDSIAKTLALYDDKSGCILVLASGNSRLSNSKFKSVFGYKPRMTSPDDTLKFTSHKIGGVCPFGVNEVNGVYLDESLKKHEYVYPACGTGNSAIKLSIKDLEVTSEFDGWVDVCN